MRLFKCFLQNWARKYQKLFSRCSEDVNARDNIEDKSDKIRNKVIVFL
jgi:hypothetical protein